MASTIPIQQKLSSQEVILESEILFEIENFKSGYDDRKEIKFASEKLTEADVSWWISAKKCNGSKVYFDFIIQVNSNIWKSKNYQFAQSLKLTNGLHLYCTNFQHFEQQLMTKSVVVEIDDLLKHLTSKDSLCVIGKLEIKSLEENTIRRLNATKFSSRYLSNKFQNILNDPTFADFKFIVQNEEFQVHKAILAAASDVMRKIFLSNLLESKEGQCRVQEIEPKIFEHLLRFIYTGQLPDAIDVIAVDLFKAAHFFGIDELVEICKENLQFKISAENAVEIYEFASVYDLTELQMSAWNVVKREILKIFFPLKNEPLPLNDIREMVAAKNTIKSILEKHA